MATYNVTVSRKGLRKVAVAKMAEAGFGGLSPVIAKVVYPKSRRELFESAMEKAQKAQGICEELWDELQECSDGLPEILADGEKAQALEEAIYMLEEAVNGLEEVTGV